jgi:hypothetical protein
MEKLRLPTIRSRPTNKPLRSWRCGSQFHRFHVGTVVQEMMIVSRYYSGQCRSTELITKAEEANSGG